MYNTYSAACVVHNDELHVLNGLAQTPLYAHLPVTMAAKDPISPLSWVISIFDTPFSGREGLMYTTHRNRIVVCGGNLPNTTTVFSDCYMSEDGRHWESRGTNHAFGKRTRGAMIECNGQLYMFGGNINGYTGNDGTTLRILNILLSL